MSLEVVANATQLARSAAMSSMANDEAGLILNTSTALAIHEVVNSTCFERLMPANFAFNRFYFISIYVFLLTVGAIENFSALCALLEHRYRNRGSKLLLINLTVANLLMALIIIPIEIVWRITYVWPTGQAGCKILQFFRALGHYSTSMMLVVISIDRYLVLTKPFARQSIKTVVYLLIVAWTAAILLSLPQVSFSRLCSPIDGGLSD